MYRKILIPLENTASDEAVLSHIRQLAKLTGAGLVLVHVADGWVARNYERFQLAESEEMREDRAYLEKRCQELRDLGFVCEQRLALGEPSEQIIVTAEELKCDLIAMSAHGHKLLGDLFLGNTIEKVRHNTRIPLLIVRDGVES